MAETKKTTTKTAEAKKATAAKAPAKKTTTTKTATAKTTTAKATAKKVAPKAVEAPVVEEKVEAALEVKAPAVETKKEISGPKLQIKLVRSKFNRLDNQKKTLEALGLRKINQIVTKPDNAATRGMIYVVKHLVEVTEIK